jgi:iron complex transport system substrate-binding protein
MDRRLKIAITAAVIVILVAAFFIYDTSQKQSAPSNGTITVRDSLGRNVTFNHTLTRIVSIDPSATATLYALGAYHDLVGGNQFDCYPPNETIPDVGNSYGINQEEIVNLSPQVVLLYGATMPSYGTQLLNLGIPVLVDNPNSIAQIEEETTMLGTLTGTLKNASLINQWMNESLLAINQSVSSLSSQPEYTAFYYLYAGGWTAGNGTFIGQIMQYAHLKNIANASGYYEMSSGLIAEDNPQVILLDQYVNYSAVTTPPYNETSAFLNDRVVSVVNDSFIDDPDFRIIYGIAWILDSVYPTFVSLPAFPIHLEYPPTYGL